jgi:hypothetical protein
MARWFITRSPETLDEDNEGELIAYQALKTLDDSWTIRWCYDYLDGKIEREGDFLILGPDGRLLVLEIKTRARVFTPTGQNDGTTEKRPEDQVQSQKAGVLRALQERCDQGGIDLEMPWTVPAIFSARENGYHPKSHGQPFTLIGGPDHLRKLPQCWEEITSGGYRAHNPEAVLNLFHSVYGDASPEAEARFISGTDRLLHDKATADFSLLEALSENSQLLVRGGPGSGKSWMAERHAHMLATHGMNVLFLCYNKALGASLTQHVARLRIHGDEDLVGKITVRTWEALCEEMGRRFAPGELPEKPKQGAPNADFDRYYAILHSALLAAVTADGFEAPYDALIVDEAQDHRNDWWEIYFALLTGGANSQMGIYYDPAQRPAFFSGEFSIAKVSESLQGKAHLQLLETRRYTRPIFDYLCRLQSEETDRLIGGLRSSYLLAGPEVILKETLNTDMAKSTAAAMLKEWFDEKLVAPEETLLLFPKDPFSDKYRQFAEDDSYFANSRIVPADSPEAGKKGFLRATSFNKSKGLDARAVVLIGSPRWEDLQPDQRQPYWIAASRARQLLAVISCLRVV